MPFQSEKQRRYLWANEPEIARDWTDTYGSGIARALGGRIGLRRGSSGAPGGGDPGMTSDSSGAGQTHSVGGEGPQGPINPHADTAPVLEQQRKTDFLNEVRRQQGEKDYTRTGQIKSGPQLGLNARKGPGIGNWASQFAGSKIGGGLGGMLFGPLGMLFGSMLGRGVGKRGYQASQTEEKEDWKDVLFGQNTLLSNVFNKQKTPTTIGGEGLGGIDLSNQDYDKAKTLDARMGMYGSRDRDLSNQGWDQLGTREGPTTRDTWNIKRPITRSNLDTGTVEHDVWGSPLEDYDPRFDINQQYREWMNERMPKTYSEGETIPNPDYYGLDIARDYNPTEEDLQLDIGPYEGERYKITDMENI